MTRLSIGGQSHMIGGAPHQDVDTRFADAMNALAGIDRAVLALTDIAGLSAQAVAEALGIGKAQARIVLMHARRVVRQQLVQDHDVEHALASAHA